MSRAQQRNKPSKEEREAEFIAAVEKLLGFPLMDWQKPLLLYIRTQSTQGQPIDLSLITRPR